MEGGFVIGNECSFECKTAYNPAETTFFGQVRPAQVFSTLRRRFH